MPSTSAPIQQTPVHSASPSEAPSSAPKSSETQQLAAASVKVNNEQAAVQRTADEMAELNRRLVELEGSVHPGMSQAQLKTIRTEVNQIRKMLSEG